MHLLHKMLTFLAERLQADYVKTVEKYSAEQETAWHFLFMCYKLSLDTIVTTNIGFLGHDFLN